MVNEISFMTFQVDHIFTDAGDPYWDAAEKVFFLAGWPLLCLCRPFCNFFKMSGFKPRELPQQAGALPTQPHISLLYPPLLSHPSPHLVTHLPTQQPMSLLSHSPPCLATHLPTQPPISLRYNPGPGKQHGRYIVQKI